MRAKFEAKTARWHEGRGKCARPDVFVNLTDDEIAPLIGLRTKVETPLYAALGEKVTDRRLRGHGPRGRRGRGGRGHGRGRGGFDKLNLRDGHHGRPHGRRHARSETHGHGCRRGNA
jgi:hypothetical protein